MKKLSVVLISLLIAAAFFAGGVLKQPVLLAEEVQAQDAPKLAIVWTSGDRDVAIKMVFMYALNEKRRGWADEVELEVKYMGVELTEFIAADDWDVVTF